MLAFVAVLAGLALAQSDATASVQSGIRVGLYVTDSIQDKKRAQSFTDHVWVELGKAFKNTKGYEKYQLLRDADWYFGALEDATDRGSVDPIVIENIARRAKLDYLCAVDIRQVDGNYHVLARLITTEGRNEILNAKVQRKVSNDLSQLAKAIVNELLTSATPAQPDASASVQGGIGVGLYVYADIQDKRLVEIFTHNVRVALGKAFRETEKFRKYYLLADDDKAFAALKEAEDRGSLNKHAITRMANKAGIKRICWVKMTQRDDKYEIFADLSETNLGIGETPEPPEAGTAQGNVGGSLSRLARATVKNMLDLKDKEIYFTDYRGKKPYNRYRAVEIDTIVWMAENLNYKTRTSWNYEGKDAGEKQKSGVGWRAWVATVRYWWPSERGKANSGEYGRLYNYTTAKKVCPGGWRLPSQSEWEGLVEYADGEKYAQNLLRSNSKAKDGGWKNNEHITNELGFTAKPGGYREPDGKFDGVGVVERYWLEGAYNGTIYGNNVFGKPTTKREEKGFAYSVRCVQDR